MKQLTAILFLALILAACAEKEADGVYVEISLENSADIDKYVLFNPNIKTVSECEASIEEALPSIMANLPAGIPNDSKATGWKCSLDNPGEGKMLKPE